MPTSSKLRADLARLYRPLLNGRGLDAVPHGPWLRDGLLALGKHPPGADRLVLAGQPGDAALLRLSPIYRRARQAFLKGGGAFLPSLVSSPRTLSSEILLTQTIEYSPIERELRWLAEEARGAKRPASFEKLLELRTYTSSVFHEQSHRRLARWLPPPGRRKDSLRRYLNLVEALVVTADMALGDELTPEVATVFYLAGSVYARGTHVPAACANRREYRNYLQACLHATYLVLEQYEPRGIAKVVAALFPTLGALGARAVRRSARLDPGFIWITNPTWQARHAPAVRRALARAPGRPLDLPADPLDHREAYLLGERWLDELGV